jgi:hypothetical protein
MIVFRHLLRKFPDAEAVVAALLADFDPLLAQEGALVDFMRKSDYTQKIAEADHRVDNVLIGIRAVVVAALHHVDPTWREAAQSLKNRLDAFGDIARKSYDAETAAVNILLRDLNSAEYVNKVALIGLAPWVAELQAAETLFEALLEERNVEAADKPQGNLKDVRRAIDVIYHRMIERIGAAATLDDTDLYTQFINELNAEIARFNEQHHHHARKDISVGEHTVVEPIATQQYTEKAVTPLPKAYYREEGKPTVELVFAKDFSLTYKNNVNVGTAEVTLHGKGAYKGQKTVTFNIAR